ncbi:LruC domain-containing protein [Croceitalea rosinachiae]|uniref:LruC domain-containing protein n=1 Tax=Croceitalea rosinachiae TaxID=3075596 RepID=A0ABU3A9M8_9FLAO|nr:LruC domain-containing protein [Croceitalea sp. F388]MDT0605788.1 LruC domain-containing protein [Croceitalea sp. F388]
MKNPSRILFILIALSFLSCVSEKDLDQPIVDDEIVITDDDGGVDDPLSALNVSTSFDYPTSKNINLILEAPDFLKGATFSIYGKVGIQDSLSIASGTFNEEGRFEKQLTVTSRLDSLLIFTNYIGLIDNVRLPVNTEEVLFDYTQFYERNGSSGKGIERPKRIHLSQKGQAEYTFIDSFNGLGVPDNLAFADVIQQNLLDDINASLPENVPGGIPSSNPDFLAGKETSLIITEEADVWVTFVSEGAGYRNVLGYYSYPLGNEPASVDDIVEHRVIFPNVSFSGSGGGLIPGDRVYLGRFPANTVISWFLAANGWFGSGVNDGNGVYYSNPDFNPESTASTRDHMVLLYDEARELTLLGFEDLRRDVATDDDFNDAVFYAKANPPDAIQIGDFAEIEVANDADGDGINDELDDFPFDADKAFNNFLPSVNSTGKLVYEDLWPSQGDYDFNDLAVDYSFNLIANGDNLITSIDASFTIENIGGALHNGFAFTLPINPNNVSSIDGQIINGGYETIASNGTETGTNTDETVIIVAGDCFDLLGQTINISIEFSSPIDANALGEVPFNAFLIANQDRAKEIHLPDLPPTSKADYLGTQDDFSDPLIGRYYKTNTNLPWALNIYEGFQTPPENVPIILQYPRFVNWANSGGTEDLDWYAQ